MMIVIITIMIGIMKKIRSTIVRLIKHVILKTKFNY